MWSLCAPCRLDGIPIKLQITGKSRLIFGQDVRATRLFMAFFALKWYFFTRSASNVVFVIFGKEPFNYWANKAVLLYLHKAGRFLVGRVAWHLKRIFILRAERWPVKLTSDVKRKKQKDQQTIKINQTPARGEIKKKYQRFALRDKLRKTAEAIISSNIHSPT